MTNDTTSIAATACEITVQAPNREFGILDYLHYTSPETLRFYGLMLLVAVVLIVLFAAGLKNRRNDLMLQAYSSMCHKLGLFWVFFAALIACRALVREYCSIITTDSAHDVISMTFYLTATHIHFFTILAPVGIAGLAASIVLDAIRVKQLSKKQQSSECPTKPCSVPR